MNRVVTPLLCFLTFACVQLKAQLLTWTPDFITESTTSSVSIYLDAAYGNKALANSTSAAYAHIGAITTKSTTPTSWLYVQTTWGSTAGKASTINIGPGKYIYSIPSGGLRTFFGITDPNEKILKIAILFRNASGSTVHRNADGSDMYVPVYDNGLVARIDNPFRQPMYTPIPEVINKSVGNTISISAKSSSAGNFVLTFNGTQVATSTTTTVTANPTITAAGNQRIIATVTSGANTSSDTMDFVVAGPSNVASLPSGVSDGINYEPGDTSVTLVLFAPNKTNVFVLGDFSNWKQRAEYQMNVTPDGKRYWIRLTGLTPGTEYGYQFLIDGNLKVADYNCEKVLDPWNDKYISAQTYPNLKPYPTGSTTGIVSVLQTAKPKYTWQVPNFQRPDKRSLAIYELLVRDFTKNQNWQSLIDTLPYLKKLGINAIELMPVNEFDGNNSWGYNPSFYFAPDKAYGTETDLKRFIDICHQNGIAVILDMVLNHSWGSSPMVQMYWDATNNTPAANSPWFNQYAKHAFNVGYDFNHQSQDTKDFVDRVTKFWLNEYKVDGYRWDLSKGFTQTQTCDNTGNNCNVGAWSSYDASRVAIWQRIYNMMQTASPNSYCIIEHFADNSEETALANSGIMLWGNMNSQFSQNIMGYSNNWDLSYGVYASRGWNDNNLVTYMEAHDEERLMYSALNYGNASGGYNTKNLNTGLKRAEALAALWATIPGPKMLWQFEEIGYDSSINFCENGTVNSSCRTSPKPLKWSYLNVPARKALYDAFSMLINLKTNANYISTFATGVITSNYNLTGAVKQLKVYDANMSCVAFANMDVVSQFANISFPQNGTWYYYIGSTGNYGTINVSNFNYGFNLQPGEYYVFTTKNARQVLPVNFVQFNAKRISDLRVNLSWNTSNEINVEKYEIQKSQNGKDFNVIGQISSAGKLSNTYVYTDLNNSSSTTYYRIVAIDKDGKQTISEIRQINSTIEQDWIITPNPAKSFTNITFKNKFDHGVVIIKDASGRTIVTKELRYIKEGQTVTFELNQLMTKGLYFVTINNENGSQTTKLVKE